MMTGLCVYQHPDGEGSVEYAAGLLICSNEADDTEARVMIGAGGLRDLAFRLQALADVIDGGLK